MSVGCICEGRYEGGFLYVGYYDINYCRRGFGTLYEKDRVRYSGLWCEDCRHGRGTEYQDGVIISGTWNMDVITEADLYYTLTGDSYQGEIRMSKTDAATDLPHGWGRHTSHNGDVFQGTFCEGKRQGLGRLQCVNGDEHSGRYNHGVPDGHGQCRLLLPTPSSPSSSRSQHMLGDNANIDDDSMPFQPCVGCYEGSWKDGQRCGRGTMKLPACSALSVSIGAGLGTSCHSCTYKGTWNDDLPDGPGEIFAFDEEENLIDGIAGVWQAGVLVELQHSYCHDHSIPPPLDEYMNYNGHCACGEECKDALLLEKPPPPQQICAGEYEGYNECFF